eukprot:TRINITY_DN54381_c0_g1_i1.p1 TRINITY_DN54381_c0_g1~~TRINITY_DN54381_c0_g1_i1.p1  ORF type:complete len:203 (+),score=50.81 TRINITY_DN54381_c0_g1_i1:165-773(+)
MAHYGAYQGYGGGTYAGNGFQAPYAADGSSGWWGGYDGGGGAWGGDSWASNGGDGKGCGKSASNGSKAGGRRFFQDGRWPSGTGAQGSATEDDPDLQEIQAAIASRQSATDAQMMACMAEAEADQDEDNKRKHLFDIAREDNESDSGDPLPPPATEDEIAEARDIVHRAQQEAIEREKMKAKVQSATKSDLQAMINARLAKK